jgi:hypothetical protein
MDGRSCCEVGHDRWAYPHACLAHQLKWHGSRGEKSFGSGRRKKFEDVRLRASQAQDTGRIGAVQLILRHVSAPGSI